jgi:hypothetical protein
MVGDANTNQTAHMERERGQLDWITNFVWGITDVVKDRNRLYFSEEAEA